MSSLIKNSSCIVHTTCVNILVLGGLFDPIVLLGISLTQTEIRLYLTFSDCFQFELTRFREKVLCVDISDNLLELFEIFIKNFLGNCKPLRSIIMQMKLAIKSCVIKGSVNFLIINIGSNIIS